MNGQKVNSIINIEEIDDMEKQPEALNKYKRIQSPQFFKHKKETDILSQDSNTKKREIPRYKKKHNTYRLSEKKGFKSQNISKRKMDDEKSVRKSIAESTKESNKKHKKHIVKKTVDNDNKDYEKYIQQYIKEKEALSSKLQSKTKGETYPHEIINHWNIERKKQ